MRSADSLYPPRDKHTRKLWDSLCKFRKSAGSGRHAATELELSALSSYMRACAYHYCERLGLTAQKLEKQVGPKLLTSVLISLPQQEAKGAAEGTEAGCKRKAEAEAVADDASDTPTQGASAQFLEADASKEAHAHQAALQKDSIKELHMCAKSADATGAIAVFEKMRAAGIPLRDAECALLLHLCGSTDPPLYNEAIRVWEAARVTSTMLKEPSWSSFIRVLCAHGDVVRADAVLQEMTTQCVGKLRLRSISPLICAAAERGDAELAASACKRLEAAGIEPTENEFIHLARLHARRTDVDGMERLLHSMMSTLPSLSRQGIDDLLAAFDLASTGTLDSNAPRSGKGIPTGRVSSWPWIASMASIDGNGLCSLSGVRLRREAVDAQERAKLCQAVERLANGARGFSAYTKWVANNGPWDFVLDGANIGFFGQGRQLNLLRAQAKQQFEAQQMKQAVPGAAGTEQPAREDSPHAVVERDREEVFDLVHIDSVFRTMRRVGSDSPQRVLIVLHEKHTSGRSQSDQEIIERWRSEGALYTTPRKQNDDLYWLYAALASGDACSVVSNDQMRDHSFGMLSPRSFMRWRERHVVRFCFREWSDEPTIQFPKPYTAVIQLDPPSGAWHIPSSEPDGAWLCLRRERPECVSTH